MYTCFVDLKQSFYRVNLEDVNNRLNQRSVNKCHINLIQHLNMRNETAIRAEWGRSRELKISSGIRQADTHCSCLFNITIDQIIES